MARVVYLASWVEEPKRIESDALLGANRSRHVQLPHLTFFECCHIWNWDFSSQNKETYTLDFWIHAFKRRQQRPIIRFKILLFHRNFYQWWKYSFGRTFHRSIEISKIVRINLSIFHFPSHKIVPKQRFGLFWSSFLSFTWKNYFVSLLIDF